VRPLPTLAAAKSRVHLHMQTSTPIESVLKRDRAVVVAGAAGVTVLAWGYLVYLAQSMSSMGSGMAMAQLQSWTAADFGFMFLMWWIMMIGMMVPTAAPMILLFATVNRRRREQEGPYVPTAVFLSGYLLVWGGFAAVATVGNWALHVNSLMSSMMGESTSAYLGGGLLIAAGVFQWSRLKYVCLSHCRSPMSFLMSDWKEGHRGALKMGLRHGTYCVGCCWVLMALLFVLGVMNLVWIATLAAFVLLEKVVPSGQRLSKVTGLLLVGWGVVVAARILG
jgi:predicted metal-binding membrane protein